MLLSTNFRLAQMSKVENITGGKLSFKGAEALILMQFCRAQAVNKPLLTIKVDDGKGGSSYLGAEILSLGHFKSHVTVSTQLGTLYLDNIKNGTPDHIVIKSIEVARSGFPKEKYMAYRAAQYKLQCARI